MRMEGTADRRLAPVVRWLLCADAAIELVVAFFLSGIVGEPHDWLEVSATAVYVAALVFLVAAGVIAAGAVLRSTTANFVRQLGLANAGGGE